jgi:hypothetical protein
MGASAVTPWTIHTYRHGRHPFPALVAWSLQLGDTAELEQLDADLPRRTWQTDQTSPWHPMFYEAFEHWAWLYERFVEEVIAPLVGEPFYYQRVPTFRVQLPGNTAVGEMHTDAQYGHPAGELNYWLPVTCAAGTSSVWVADDDGQLQAPEVCPGQFVAFSAVDRLHGNKPNATGRSRVSFDFRTLPVRLLPAEPKRTEHTKLAFAPGGYYAAEAMQP